MGARNFSDVGCLSLMAIFGGKKMFGRGGIIVKKRGGGKIGSGP